MSDKTTSDQLKHFFAEHGGGEEKDWKRLSKKKNPEGQVVRQFENKKTGVQLEVVETAPGQFKARRLADTANAAFTSTPELTRAPVIETDTARNAAADAIIEQLDEEDEIAPSLLKQAGTALANRFVFAIGGDPAATGLMDGLFVEFSPKGRDYDQHLEHVISHLLPKNNGGEAMELTFDFSAYKDPVRLVSDLMKKGFIWDETYQAQMDASTGMPYLATLKAAFVAPTSATPAAKPPTP